MIPVSQPFLPPKDEYAVLMNQLWESKWLTNNGVLVRQLEKELESYLEVPALQYVSNGTIALQLAIKALDIRNEIITTPFSFVATTTSILWENCQPVFVDIDPTTLCMDAAKIEEAITDRTEAILATHVFGIPCDVEKIEEIAARYQLKVIYDAAHAFGVEYKGKSLLSYGDLSTVSFHATKLFHTVEGGGIVVNRVSNYAQRLKQLRNFGIGDEGIQVVGINGKNSEFHAAMGLCNLKYMDAIIKKRRVLTEKYDSLLQGKFQRLQICEHTKYNYAYYPIIFEREEELKRVQQILKENRIATRRYFYPSLNTLPYLLEKQSCPVSEDISNRILCLPLFYDLNLQDVERISSLIMKEGQFVSVQ